VGYIEAKNSQHSQHKSLWRGLLMNMMEYTISLWLGWIEMGILAITMTTNASQYRYTQLPTHHALGWG
jgi:cellulase/cellobiase CelA1